MKRKTQKKKALKRKITNKRRRNIGGGCGCNNTNPLFGKINGGNVNPYIMPSNSIPLNTYKNDPISMTATARSSQTGGKSRKYLRKQTPFYKKGRKQSIRGGDALSGSTFNPVSSFGTTSGIPFSSNTLFGISNQSQVNGIADIPFFGSHNPPLV